MYPLDTSFIKKNKGEIYIDTFINGHYIYMYQYSTSFINDRSIRLIHLYRSFGHLAACIYTFHHLV